MCHKCALFFSLFPMNMENKKQHTLSSIELMKNNKCVLTYSRNPLNKQEKKKKKNVGKRDFAAKELKKRYFVFEKRK